MTPKKREAKVMPKRSRLRLRLRIRRINNSYAMRLPVNRKL
jgi:hypothetical protein